MITAVPLRGRALVAVLLISVLGVAAFTWPLFVQPGSALIAHANDGGVLFAVLLPLMLVVALTQIADGTLSSKAVALLGVLSAVIAALRPLGAGVAGLEPIWAVLVLGAAALGPGFGFLLGAVSLFASALLTGGVGPWLPFQMLGAAWVGLAAGTVGRTIRGGSRRELVPLAAVASVGCVLYGWVLNMWFWPFATGLAPEISFAPGAGIAVNLAHWMKFNLVTSMGYDLPRAILTACLILGVGRPILASLRRAARRVSFDLQPVGSTPAEVPTTT